MSQKRQVLSYINPVHEFPDCNFQEYYVPKYYNFGQPELPLYGTIHIKQEYSFYRSAISGRPILKFRESHGIPYNWERISRSPKKPCHEHLSDTDLWRPCDRYHNQPGLRFQNEENLQLPHRYGTMHK